MSTPIAITGATGQLGRLIVHKLKAHVPITDVVALVRTPANATDLGVAVRAADYTIPATLDHALAGIDTVLLISSSMVGQRIAQHRNVIAAARKAGVRHIVYTSLLHADTSPLRSLAEEHHATEVDLAASGLAFTILRNGWYTENYTAFIPAARAGGAFLGSDNGGKLSTATRADYADAAVAVLTSGGHDRAIYELAGDAAYTLHDLAAELSRQTGTSIPYTPLSEAAYAAALIGLGFPDGLAHALASYGVDAAHGALFDDSHQLAALIGRPTTPLATAVAMALA